MSAATETTTPEAAVRRWWDSMRAGDLAALEQLLLDDYISSGGPVARTLGRDEVLAQAREFVAAATIESHALSDFAVRRHGDVAVCAYAWSESGTHAGRPFALDGLATDVLVRDPREGLWRHQAHHTSMVAT
ncbi:nuclear transport factor 2 family protein [Conexibacter arvalis]|uniref:Ketosteroid isomerase-like protein n=1 Tax=Conexibacter arvalis TaxID=912552 RepID=A0A840IDS6_9ACTN|nr:nuclear transport factor 2 family protein [Conexibacter arvalis]MBB4662224.1 ketosteroid isomerase-like protein [Conexibacter arvalis]